MSKTVEIQKITSAFAPVELPPQQTNEPCFEHDIVDTLIIDTYETDADGNVRPVTKQVETKRYNRKAYIESFSDEVGLNNILEKIAQGAVAEDKYSILTNRKQGSVADLRGFENINTLGDVEALAAKAQATFRNLDPALKKNMSFKEFCSKFGNDDLVAYIDSRKAAQEAAAKKGEGE